MRFRRLGVRFVHVVRVVLPAIEDAQNEHLLSVDPEQDPRASLKPDDADSRSDGLANDATFRKRG